jgi:hypothetical protein
MAGNLKILIAPAGVLRGILRRYDYATTHTGNCEGLRRRRARHGGRIGVGRAGERGATLRPVSEDHHFTLSGRLREAPGLPAGTCKAGEDRLGIPCPAARSAVTARYRCRRDDRGSQRGVLGHARRHERGGWAVKAVQLGACLQSGIRTGQNRRRKAQNWQAPRGKNEDCLTNCVSATFASTTI